MNDAARKALEQNEWVRKLLESRDYMAALLAEQVNHEVSLWKLRTGSTEEPKDHHLLPWIARARAAIAKAQPIPTTCPDCKATDQYDQFCRFCAQHFGPNTNRPTRETP